MKNLIKNLFKGIKRSKEFIRLREHIKNSLYFIVFQKKRVKENVVLIESRGGDDFASNIFFIAEELLTRGYIVYLSYKVDKIDKIEKIIRSGNLKNLKLVRIWSVKYYKLLATAKFLFNDVAFDWKYIKREQQIYVNTWHGTPLKTLGYDVKNERYIMGNLQRNFLMADYITSPSEYYSEVILKAYDVDVIFQGKILCSGMPRNFLFFSQKDNVQIKTSYGIEKKQVIVYMPTWRGTHKKAEGKSFLQNFLEKIEEKLDDSQILYLKFHNLDKASVDISKFKHISFFPQDIEPYKFLACADCLVTDYSSVLFDFANTRKKIILFTYDEKEYMANRGTYFNMEELPFPRVRTVEKLIEEINTAKQYDDSAFLRKYCTYDNADTVKSVLDQVIHGEERYEVKTVIPSGKKNILIYCGGIEMKNGIVTSLKNLINSVDVNKYNFYFAFCRSSMKSQPSIVTEMREGIRFYVISSPIQSTLLEHISYRKYFFKRIKKNRYIYYWNRLMERESKKHFPQPIFDTVIDFEGYGMHFMVPVLQRYKGQRIIYVHNNMVQEIKVRNNLHPLVIRDAYSSFNKVAIVSESLRDSTVSLGAKPRSVVKVSNTHNYQEVENKSLVPIKYDRDTTVKTYFPSGIEGTLNTKGYKFITIGRFSPEKGHKRLIDAFDIFCDRYDDAQLIIIGGHGPLYNETINYAAGKNHWRNITIIKSISNPMPILKKCDLFILPSFYEGLGLVMLEADCLNVPVYSTDIDGAGKFLKDYNGHVVDNSTVGILSGMYDFVDGKVHSLDIDYEEYNRTALKEFYNLFDEEN